MDSDSLNVLNSKRLKQNREFYYIGPPEGSVLEQNFGQVLMSIPETLKLGAQGLKAKDVSKSIDCRMYEF